MKVSFIGHASILIETQGLRILSDPWWRQPCFGIQWWNYPLAAIELVEAAPIDYVYISHGHLDHLHLGTLTKINRTAKVIIPAQSDMAPSITKAGFTVIEIAATHDHDLGNGVRARIMPTCNDDSLMAITDGRETCVNLNDALHAAPRAIQEQFVQKLRSLYPVIDYVFCGYGVASHFPNCYRIEGKDPEATAIRRQGFFNEQWAWLIAHLAPRWGFPFAADVALLEEELFWSNEAMHNGERPTATIKRLSPRYTGSTFDIAPGFQIESGKVVTAVSRQPTRAADLRRDLAAGITKCNQATPVDAAALQLSFDMLARNLELCRAYLASYARDYTALLQLRGTASAIVIEKRGGRIDLRIAEDAARERVHADLVITTRAEYLRWSLSTKYGNETIFVGSGALFDFSSRRTAETNLQRELVVLIRRQIEPLPARAPAPNALVAGLKRLVKRVLGIRQQDLYDLGAWTVWKSDKR